MCGGANLENAPFHLKIVDTAEKQKA